MLVLLFGGNGVVPLFGRNLAVIWSSQWVLETKSPPLDLMEGPYLQISKHTQWSQASNSVPHSSLVTESSLQSRSWCFGRAIFVQCLPYNFAILTPSCCLILNILMLMQLFMQLVLENLPCVDNKNHHLLWKKKVTLPVSSEQVGQVLQKFPP